MEKSTAKLISSQIHPRIWNAVEFVVSNGIPAQLKNALKVH
jgi:hypothetical protein